MQQVATDELSFVGSKTDEQYRFMDIPPQKGDEALNVAFFKRPHNGEELDWIKISIPGNTCTVIEEPINDDHKGRFWQKWQEYQGFINATGTPIADWGIGEAMTKEFLRHDFSYVEQVSLAPDNTLRSIAGGGISWRNKALEFINRGTPTARQVIDDQSKRIADLEDKINKLMSSPSLLAKTSR